MDENTVDQNSTDNGIIFEQPSLLREFDQKVFLTETGEDAGWPSSGQRNVARTRNV